jgi:hypothetical protein
VRIAPDNHVGRLHDVFEDEVAQVFIAHGFRIAKAPYHATMPAETVTRLSRCKCPTARHIRARADRVAIHQHRDQVVAWEVKTNPGVYPRLSIEVMPLIYHQRFPDAPTLYICRHIKDQWDAAFWTTKLPKFDTIFLTEACGPYERQLIQESFKASGYWKYEEPDIQEYPGSRTHGSGDAFALISRESLCACIPNWRKEIEQLATVDDWEHCDFYMTSATTCDLCGRPVPAWTPHRCP